MKTIGTTTSHYRIIETVRADDMAVVYKAEDCKLERTVALKFLPRKISGNRTHADHIVQQIRAASALDHPNICTIYEIDETSDGELFIAMAFYEGITLQQIIDKRDASLRESLDLVLQVVRGLAKAHENGIVYGGLRPSDIIITQDGIAKILGFGLAQNSDTVQNGPTEPRQESGSYDAPEQIRGEESDHRTDIWTIGALLSEMFAWAVSDREDGGIDHSNFCNQEQVLLFPKECRDTARSIMGIAERCLEKDPLDRYQSAEELAVDISTCLAQMERLTSPEKASLASSRTQNKWVRFISIGSITVLLLISLFYSLLRWRDRQNSSGPVSTKKILAVFPFTVHGGPELYYLKEGMVDLLYTTLNGAGELRTVDPRAIINQVKILNKSEPNLEDSRRISKIFSADYYILGSVFAIQNRIRCNATIYRTLTNESLSTSISVEGDAEDLFTLVDGVTRQIFMQAFQSSSDRENLLGVRTTHSMPALRAYMQATLHNRQGHLLEAKELYSRAISLDSTFAMAWLSRGMLDLGGLFLADEARFALGKAAIYQEKLSTHDRRLLDYNRSVLNGENETALEILTVMTQDDPNDLIAWSHLAAYSIQVNNLYGRSISEPEIRDAFKRILEQDPENPSFYQTVLLPAYLWNDDEYVDEIITKLEQLSPDFNFAWMVLAPRAFIDQDPRVRQKVEKEASIQDDFNLFCGVHNSFIFAPEPAAVMPMAREMLQLNRHYTTQAMGYLTLAVAEMAGGRWREAMMKLDSLDLLYPDVGTIFKVLYIPFYQYHTGCIPDKLWGDAFTLVRRDLPPNLQMIGDDIAAISILLPQFTLYSAGLSALFQGDLQTALAKSVELAAAKPPRDIGSLIRIWSATLKSLVAIREGQTQKALKILEGEPIILRFPLYWQALYSTALFRYLRAEQLYQLGRSEEAQKWYQTIAELYFYDLPYRAPALLKMAQIQETLHQPDLAIKYYKRFLALWRDCDPEFKPLVLKAESALTRLEAENN